MAKDPTVWIKARTLFELGQSLSEISRMTGISKSTISKRSNERKWIKGDKEPLVEEEAQNIIMRDEIDVVKRIFSEQETNAYNEVLTSKVTSLRRTHEIAEKFQKQINARLEADDMAIEALIAFKVKELERAKTPEDILKVEMRFREYMAVISDYDEIKKGVEANDKASITRGEAPRFAPKTDIIHNTLNVKNDTEDDKGRF